MGATIKEINDRVKLPFTFDVAQLQQEVTALQFNQFLYYDVMPLRSPAHFVDPSLPVPPPVDNYADGSWTDWKNTQQLEQSPYLKSIVAFFQEHTTVTLVRLLRLNAGEIVKEHTDPTLGLQIEDAVIRLTIPIQCDEGVEFYLNNTIVPMQLGECWYMRLTDPHRIINGSQRERINFTIDMIPNDWVKAQISQSL